MTTRTKNGASMAAEKQKITFERTYKAPLEDVWDLWTTREGIESWWGPEGFVAKVHKLDLREGGDLEDAFTATAPEQIEALRGMGVPLTQVVRGTYKEVSPRRRLVYTNLADFIPGVEPYEVTIVVEFYVVPHGVRMVMTQDAMHEAQWTKLASMGWEMELGKLAKLLERRYPARATKRKAPRK
jgi:uncharacterized protein YndB with AHSA1/START domain